MRSSTAAASDCGCRCSEQRPGSFWPATTLVTDGDRNPPFHLFALMIDEMNGTWIAELEGFAAPAREWMQRLAAASAVSLETPVFVFELPATPEDRANRAEFVEACMAL